MSESGRAASRRLRQVAAHPRVVVYWAKLMTGAVALRLGLRLKAAWLVALAWRIYLNPSALHHPADPAARIASVPGARRTLIVLDRSGGNEDIEEAFAGHTASCRVGFLNRDAVKRVCAAFLPVDAVTDDQYVTEDPQVEAAKARYRVCLVQVLRWYQRWFGPVAFVQFNLYYYAEVELASACTTLGIPFLTAQKECLRPAQAWLDIAPQLREARGPFTGSHVAVYNRACAEAFVTTGVVPAERMRVVGCARMDASHRIRRTRPARAGRPALVYFLIDPRASAPLFHDGPRGWVRGFGHEGDREITWTPLIDAVNAAVLRFASARPDVDIICKGKSGFSDVQLAAFGGRLPETVRTARDFPGHVLLERADAVLGFNTTAVFEAMAAGVPTVIPEFFSMVHPTLRAYRYPLEGAAACPSDESALCAALDEALATGPGREIPLRVQEVLDLHLGNADGQSGHRLRSWIETAVHGVDA